MYKLDITMLSSVLWQQLSDEAADWLKSSLYRLAPDQSNSVTICENYLRYSAMAKRKLGSTLLKHLPENSSWQTDEVGRLLLLSQLLQVLPGEDRFELVKAVYKNADEYEQIAIVKGLEVTDETGQLTDLAISAGRTNDTKLFSAIALHNAYPARFYQERAFNQLVLKALFLDLDINQIIGLKQRQNRKLSALAIDLVNERLLAGRTPPDSILLAIDVAHLGSVDQACYLLLSTTDNHLIT